MPRRAKRSVARDPDCKHDRLRFLDRAPLVTRKGRVMWRAQCEGCGALQWRAVADAKAEKRWPEQYGTAMARRGWQGAGQAAA